ncbi:Dbx/Hlx [Bisporella sp. PMI_857]|nr:Dbx/Hlx [Bisporella sp. PMI_857]
MNNNSIKGARFSADQRKVLEAVFSVKPNLKKCDRAKLADIIDCLPNSVKAWFENTR